MTNEQIDSLLALEDRETDSREMAIARGCIRQLAGEVRRLREFAWFDRLDSRHKPTHVLHLLNEGEISFAKACEWLRAYAAGNEMPIIDAPVGDIPDDMSFAEAWVEVKRLRAALAEAEAKPSTEEIIKACGGDWVLEEWDEEHPEDFVLEVMRAMRDEQQRWWKEANRLQGMRQALELIADLASSGHEMSSDIAEIAREALDRPPKKEPAPLVTHHTDDGNAVVTRDTSAT